MRKKPQIMIVDDDRVTCDLLCEVFAREGFEPRFQQSGEAALASMVTECPSVMVSDIRMGTPFDGLALLDHVRRDYPEVPVILMTAFGSIETAIRAVKEGAFDYISKPFEIKALVATVKRAVCVQSATQGVESTDKVEPAATLTGYPVARSPEMLEIYKIVARISDLPSGVLITGESGTGKELVARAIHMHGVRHSSPFVAVNCGALTETLLETELFGHVKGSFTGATANKEGIFEQAAGGTVFLDEISETSSSLQVKLLRVLQEREVVPVGGRNTVKIRARVIAASNTDLEELSRKGAFRRDLLYRLNIINLHVPPLRARKDDIPLLTAHFLRKHAPEGALPLTIDESAMNDLLNYGWPGNVRELENTIERAIALCQGSQITQVDLPPKISQLTTEAGADALSDEEVSSLFSGLPSIEEMQRRYLLHVVEATGGNRKRAAQILGVDRKTIYRMAARYHLKF
jgi:DNA-binding NtrC family response regulator